MECESASFVIMESLTKKGICLNAHRSHNIFFTYFIKVQVGESFMLAC